jgi:hypothetical protein
MKRVIKFVYYSWSLLAQNGHPVDKYLFQIIGNENEVDAAKCHLCYAEKDVHP